LAKERYKFIYRLVAANAFSNDAETKIVNVDSIPDGWQGLDAGPKSLANFEK
jgi:phosphoglycerate kinase